MQLYKNNCLDAGTLSTGMCGPFIIILSGFLFIKFRQKCYYVNVYVFIEYKVSFIYSAMSITGPY
jgi:hypothetical protein